MAVALNSNTSYNIVSQDQLQTDKVLFHIKLTDSCLKSLERHKHQTSKNSKSGALVGKPLIRFKTGGTSKTGSLFIPSKGGSGKDGATFTFTGASLFSEGSSTGLDCLQQKKGESQLKLLGNITEKLTISATNDSYETTRNRMTEAENKRIRNSAKVIELSANDGAKKPRRTTTPRPNPFRKLKTTKFGASASSLPKNLKEKVIHFLALKPLNKLELRAKLEKDGVKLKDLNVLSNILLQVSSLQDNHFCLHRHLYSEIQVDTWPGFTNEDREAIKTKLVSEMGTSVERLSPGLLASGGSSNNSSKRPLAGGANPAGKKQRIAHGSATRRSSMDKSPPKITARPSETAAYTKLKKENTKLNHKKEKSTTDKTTSFKVKNSKHHASNNDKNNNSCSPTDPELSANEDYLIKYPKITSYSQRCSYKEEFMRGHSEYTTIKERSDLVSNEFRKLREKLTGLSKDSEAAQAIHTEILKLYDEKKEEWTRDRKKIDILYPKLSHIKQLVIQYDKDHLGQTENNENG